MEKLRQGYDLNDIVQITKFLEQLVEILSQIDSAIERELYMRNAAQEYDISTQALETELGSSFRKKKKDWSRKTKKMPYPIC
jgi:DNA primase